MGSRANSGWAERNQRTLSSFSSREKVQVEYTSTPPSRTARAAESKMARWRWAQAAGLSGLHWATAAGSRRNMPSPEQGASTSTLSKKPWRLWHSRWGWQEDTTAFGTPRRSTLESSAWARDFTISLDQSSPCPASSPAIWVDLPPGVAHKSSTFSPGWGSSTVTAEQAEGSCT